MKNCLHPGNAAVRGDQLGASFVTPAHQLEEQVRRVGLQWQVAEIVDDQQLRFRPRQQFPVQAPLAVRLGEPSDQRRRRRELSPDRMEAAKNFS
jgi:hypothetical protein